MAFCPNCGAQAAAGSRFCTYCGTAISSVPAAVSAAAPYAYGSVYTGTGYGVMLVSLDRCSRQAASDLLSDTCGYTDAEAMNLLGYIPTFVAQGLTQDQAVCLAQTLTEYGMQAAIYDRNGNCTMDSGMDSVFDSNGSLIGKVVETLGLIGIVNRISRAIRRLVLPKPPQVYKPPRPVVPPRPRRQVIHHPAPVQRPARSAGFHGPLDNGFHRDPRTGYQGPFMSGFGGNGGYGRPGGHGGRGGRGGNKR